MEVREKTQTSGYQSNQKFNFREETMKTLSVKLFSGLLALVLVASTFAPASANPGSTFDFEGLAEGAFVNSVASGAGISGDPVDGSVAVFAYNPFFPGVNAAMIFDATCNGGCSGGADDL